MSDVTTERNQLMAITTILNTNTVQVKAENSNDVTTAPQTIDLAETIPEDRNGLYMLASVAAEQQQGTLDPFQEQLQRMAADYSQFKAGLTAQARKEAVSAEVNAKLEERINNMENDLVLAEREKVKAQDQLANLDTEIERQHNEAMSWKVKFETTQEQIIQANTAEESEKVSLKQEKEKLQEHLQVLWQTVVFKMKSANEAEDKWRSSETAKNVAQEDSRLAKIEAHRARLEVVSVRKELQETRQEIDKVKEQTDLTKAQHASAFKDYAGKKNASTVWQTKYNEMSAYAEHTRQVTVAWEAEHNKLRASVDTVLGGLQVNGRIGGGQMESLTEISGGTGQSQGHGVGQFRYIMPRPNQR